ncbi:hypothetical protein DPMN_028540 [Dreissena polymorpha]|uniref:Uncharacterized protein n=1 Tax=Dreissena polymorpha TaxID=45954 RepID=A0A9D4REG3_DREPO|nr:hypothetical protein DPMN_028540 [Dreissena polymorpha]
MGAKQKNGSLGRVRERESHTDRGTERQTERQDRQIERDRERKAEIGQCIASSCSGGFPNKTCMERQAFSI